MLLEGIHLPLTTPFHPDGRLNLHKLEYNVDRYSRTPVAGLALLGPSGEGSGLTDAETRAVLEAAGRSAAKEKVLLADVGRDSVTATLELAEAAAKAGFDAVLAGVPGSCAGLDLETRTYFLTVADRSPVPLVPVSGAEGSSTQIAVEMLAELAGHSKVIGVVDWAAASRLPAVLKATASVSREIAVTNVFSALTGRMLRASVGDGGFVSAESLSGGTAVAIAPPAPALKTRTKRVGFQVLAGRTSGIYAALEAGAVGALPRFGACAPQACNEVFQAWKDEDPELAREKQQRIAEIGDGMDRPGAAGAIKYGCDLNAYFGGRARLPLLSLNAVEREEIERAMAGLRN